ncbi:RNA-binding protein [Anaeramoeba ignava]|uniref:RNA-binding protein n=1 Tax=Anaeramoeba ignava TaxID=1746090 RepID=A0A9Q0R5G0_ANAIG|nr:RNA-binding protein [Anaeramoeba ignava]
MNQESNSNQKNRLLDILSSKPTTISEKQTNEQKIINQKNLEEKLKNRKKEKTRTKPTKKEKEEINQRTIFIGNLPVEIKKKKLEKIFKEFGKIESIRFRSTAFEILPDKKIKPKKVSAIKKEIDKEVSPTQNCYLLYENKESAKKAVKMNGIEIEGYKIHVCLEENKKDYNEKLCVFVGNLNYNVTELEIQDFFKECGEINYVHIVRDKFTRRGKGFAYVNFKHRKSVPFALQLNGEILKERPIRVSKVNYSQDSEQKVNQNQKNQKNQKKRKNFKERKPFPKEREKIRQQKVGAQNLAIPNQSEKSNQNQVFNSNLEKPKNSPKKNNSKNNSKKKRKILNKKSNKTVQNNIHRNSNKHFSGFQAADNPETSRKLFHKLFQKKKNKKNN